jgi:restriction system protein
VFDKRVAWAKSYLQQAGALNSHLRGYFQISQRGKDILRESPQRITIKYLERFPEFVEFRYAGAKGKDEAGPIISPEVVGQTPEEALENAYQRLRKDLASEILVRVKKASPVYFERLVVALLLKMGYGGSRTEAGEAIGSSGDEGIIGANQKLEGVTSGRLVNCRLGMLFFPLVGHLLGLENLFRGHTDADACEVIVAVC